MKKIIYLFLLGCLLSSCESFLEEQPTTEMDREAIYSTVAGANSILNGCYATMTAYDYFGYRYFHTVSVTSGLWVSTRSNEVPFTSLQILPNEVNIEKLYTGIYKTIGVANDILCYLPESKIDSTAKSTILGEASLIRAINFFNLVRLYGKVPLYTKPVTSFQGAHLPRASVEDVYAQILNDLEDAYQQLPEPAKQKTGRPHRYAAKALMAKVYVTMAGNEESSAYWQKAYDAALSVKDEGQYKLVYPFTDLFGADHKNTVESIFELQFSAVQAGLNLTQVTLPQGNSFTINSTGGNQWGKTRPSKQMYDIMSSAYPEDPRIEGSMLHTKYYNIAKAKDINIYPSTKKTPGANNDDLEYPFIKKYVDKGFTTTSNCNYVYMRYADVLLLLAEAANETGKTGEAIEIVNSLLDRARDKNGDGSYSADEVSPEAWDMSLTKEDVRSLIMRERLIELVGEGDEWYTIRRRGYDALKSVLTAHNNHPAIKDKPELARYVYRLPEDEQAIRRNLLLPFPLSEITTNEAISNDDQNFGY
ncbi:MAG: RagB/SusD family nutrient uptake outer membrane protein [Bacteroidales bacterium]